MHITILLTVSELEADTDAYIPIIPNHSENKQNDTKPVTHDI
jgi:hypothetical protein